MPAHQNNHYADEQLFEKVSGAVLLFMPHYDAIIGSTHPSDRYLSGLSFTRRTGPAASRGNRPRENRERGFQHDEMMDFESSQNQYWNIIGITRDH